MLTITTSDQGHSGDGGPLGDSDTVNITVDSVPDAPVVEDFGKSTNEDTPVSFAASSDFESHFSDGDNDSLVAVRIDSLPAHGDLQLSGSDVTAHQEIPAGELNNLAYIPDANWNGADSFDWNAYDGSLYGESNATITITVSAVNDAPAVADFDKSGDEDTPIDFTAGDFTTHTTDVDIGDSVETVQIKSLPTHGTLKLAGPNVTLNQVIPAGQLDDLTYTPDQNWSGADEFDWNASDGDTYASTDATVDITIDALNDPPVNSVPGPQTVNEDSDLVFRSSNGNAISTSDLDAEIATISTQLSVNHGTLTVGASDATVTGNGTAALTIVGAQSQISITLGAGLTYRANQDYNGPDTLTMTTDDRGNNGAGGAQTDIDTASITVNPVNDAPVVADFDKSGDEDTPIDFTAGDFTTHTTDVDIGDSVETVQIKSLPTHGALKLDGSNVTLNQEIPAGQLGDLTYTPDQNRSGVDEFDWNASDGDTYASTDATVDITIDALNDPPVNSVPGSQTVNEDADLVFRSSNGNGLSISDPDAENETISIQLSVNHGTLNVDVSSAGVTGNGTATVTIVGAQSQISITLGAGVTYHANQDYNGADTLTMTTDDMGNSGAGGAKTDVDTISITVTAVNDAPVNSLPAPQTVKEDAQLVFDGDLAISVADLDAGSSNVQVTLRVTHGALTLGQTAGLAFSAGDGTADAAMTFSGTLTDVNAALDGLAYLANEDYNGADTLSVTSNDLGHTGIGGALADTDSIGIIVTPVNDPPVNSVPGSQQTNEEENLLITGLGVSDVDAASDDVMVTLGARHGALTVGSGAPGGPIITGNGTYTVTLTGAVGNIDTLLSSGVTYLGDVDYFGADALTMSSDDLGHNGESPAGAGLHAAATGLTDSDTVAITVHNVNDPPVAVDDSVITDEDTLLRIRALSNDSDADGDALSVSAITQGAFGIVQINGDGTILYNPFAEYFGLDHFTYTATDGNGTNDTATITVTIRAVNDPPVAEDDQATTQQDTAHDVAVLTNDSDMDGDILEVTGVTEPAHGTAEIIDGGLIRYTPADGFYGNDAFEYTVDDGQEGFDTATVRMTVIEIGGDEPPPPPTSITFQQGMGGYFGMEDTYLDLGNPTTPFGDADRLRMKTTENADALLRFNLAVMPAGTTIQQASVRLFAIDHSGAVNHDPIPITLRVYSVLRDWDENQATWYSTGSGNWAKPGCQTAGVDYAPEYTEEVVAFDAVQEWIEFDITDLAQYWVDHPETNYGIVIKAYLHSETVSYSFWSSQGPLTALRPQLRLDYTLPQRP